jgi:UPF0176 protein
MKKNFFKVAAFYKFTPLYNLSELQETFMQFLTQHKIKGTILLAHEGINGTLAGSSESINKFKDFLKMRDLLSIKNFKTFSCEDEPFLRLKVKLKNEIVSIGNVLANPQKIVGEYVQPEDWNDLITEDDVLVLDTRNIYEYSIGTFKDSIQPSTINFREFPQWVEELENSQTDKNKKIAMFCTGGIRCEKASSLMKAKGFNNIFHLQGGILNYIKKIDEEHSLWEGECFVFDDRVALNQNLEVGLYDMCHGCRMPITEEDKVSPKYNRGISCPNCFDSKTPGQQKRYADRIKQIDLAKKRGERHIGSIASSVTKG